MKPKIFFLPILFFTAALALFPILRYIVVFRLDLLPDLDDRYVVARVLFSGPILIVVGLLMIFRYKKYLNKILGILFFIIGLVWFLHIIYTFLQEAG